MSMPESKTNGRIITFAEAIREAIAEEMRRDQRVFVIGEANRINRGTAGKPKGRNRASGEVPRGLAFSQSWNTRSQPIYAWVR